MHNHILSLPPLGLHPISLRCAPAMSGCNRQVSPLSNRAKPGPSRTVMEDASHEWGHPICKTLYDF